MGWETLKIGAFLMFVLFLEYGWPLIDLVVDVKKQAEKRKKNGIGLV